MVINLKEDLNKGEIPCPFQETCKLPKDLSLCSMPNCRICPEFDNRAQKMK